MENLSIVIPVHDESKNVLKLANEIEAAFSMAKFDWEVIWVNDCSKDDTQNVLVTYSKSHPKHTVIHLHHQSGQSAAVLSGIYNSKFSLIGTLDGDGQNSPYDLLALKELLEGNDLLLAQGVRLSRHDNKLRLFSSALANFVRNVFLGVELQDVGCAVRVFRHDIVREFPAFKGFHRFLPVFVAFFAPERIMEHPVNHRPRINGISKYGVWNRLWVGIYDLFGAMWIKKRGFRLPQFERIS